MEFNKELFLEETLTCTLNELLNCLGNLRSGVTKLALICLNELMGKVHKKVAPSSEGIVLALLKRSLTTSEFMQ